MSGALIPGIHVLVKLTNRSACHDRRLFGTKVRVRRERAVQPRTCIHVRGVDVRVVVREGAGAMRKHDETRRGLAQK